MKTNNLAPGAHKKTIRRRNIIITTIIVILAVAVYIWHGVLMQLLLNQKSIGRGLPVYSVEQTNHTDAYGWFTVYPKLDKPNFDKVVSKYINNTKGVFLAHVNFDAHGSYPKDDLTISYKLTTHTATVAGVVLMGNQVVGGAHTSWARHITYDDTSGKVTDEPTSPIAVPSDTKLSGGTVPQSDPLGPDCSVKKCLALVFAGGPSYVTPQFLDILKQNHVKATFFELGSQVARYGNAAKRTLHEGHVIGNGTYDYRNLMVAPQNDAINRLAASASAIELVTGVRPGMTIAPYGAITDELAKKVNRVFVKSTTEETSWQAGSSEALYQSIVADAKRGIIMQSYDTDQVTADAYKKAIPKLIEKGYTFVTVPQLLGFDKGTTPGVYQASE